MAIPNKHRKRASITLEEQRDDYTGWWAGKLDAQDRAIKRAERISRMLITLGQEYPAVAGHWAETAHPFAGDIYARGEEEMNATKRPAEPVARAEFAPRVDAVRGDENESSASAAASQSKSFDGDLQLALQQKPAAPLESQVLQMASSETPQKRETEARFAARPKGRLTDRDQDNQPKKEEGHFDHRLPTVPIFPRKNRQTVQRQKREPQKRFSPAQSSEQVREARERNESSQAGTESAGAGVDAQ